MTRTFTIDFQKQIAVKSSKIPLDYNTSSQSYTFHQPN